MRSNPAASTYREGVGEPLVLVHIGSNPWHKWEPVLPALVERFDVFVPTLPGWPGGPDLTQPVSLATLVDAVASAMDAAGIATAHIVGNSLGGWLAFELAARGRARSVTAFSPAGGWTRRGFDRCSRWFSVNQRVSIFTRPLAPLFLRFASVRRVVFAVIIKRGERLTPAQAINQTRDTMPGEFDKILPALGREDLRSYPDFGVPAMVAWSGDDRFTPLHPNGDSWRAAAPHAQFRVLPDVGHLPMFDDPAAVLETILEVATPRER